LCPLFSFVSSVRRVQVPDLQRGAACVLLLQFPPAGFSREPPLACSSLKFLVFRSALS